MRKAFVLSYEMKMKAAVLAFIACILCFMVLVANTTKGYADDGSTGLAVKATQASETAEVLTEANA